MDRVARSDGQEPAQLVAARRPEARAAEQAGLYEQAEGDRHHLPARRDQPTVDAALGGDRIDVDRLRVVRQRPLDDPRLGEGVARAADDLALRVVLVEAL